MTRDFFKIAYEEFLRFLPYLFILLALRYDPNPQNIILTAATFAIIYKVNELIHRLDTLDALR